MRSNSIVIRLFVTFSPAYSPAHGKTLGLHRNYFTNYNE